MRHLPYFLLFLLFMGLSITASNQDSRLLESQSGPVFKVKAVYVDSEGVKWFGTNRGLCRYNDLSWRYYTDADYLAGKQVNALAFEQSDYGQELWVATTEGVSVVLFDSDGITGSTSYTSDDGLLNNDVTDIAIDSRAGKFFGSVDGITWFHDGIMDQLVFFDYYGSMFDKPIRQMDIYGDTLYIAQDGGIGRLVSGVDGISGASRWASEFGITPFSGNIRSVEVNGMDKQWFGTDVGVETHTGYFAKENWDLYSTENGLVNKDVISIAEDPDGGLWFGTYGGVSHLSDGVWTSYTTADGLLNDTVYDIGFDLDGSVWLGTGSGACRLKDGTFLDFITAVPHRIVAAMDFMTYYNNAAESVHLAYHLASSAPVMARLYNVSGMLVGEWSDLPQMEGDHRIELPLHGLSEGSPGEGIYMIQLIQGSQTRAKKIVIIY